MSRIHTIREAETSHTCFSEAKDVVDGCHTGQISNIFLRKFSKRPCIEQDTETEFPGRSCDGNPMQSMSVSVGVDSSGNTGHKSNVPTREVSTESDKINKSRTGMEKDTPANIKNRKTASAQQCVPISNTEHTSSSRRFQCEICGECSCGRSNLIRHMKNHIGWRELCCDTCGKEFYQRAHLKGHMKTHTAAKEFECEICGKTFLRKIDMTQHVDSHAGIKNFNCSLCSKAYSRRCHLNRHIESVHAGVKKYKCHFCGKSFRGKQNLDTHENNHVGNRNFTCQACGMAFSCKQYLVRHMRSHSSSRNFKCQICGRAYKSGANLSRHRKSHVGFYNLKSSYGNANRVLSR